MPVIPAVARASEEATLRGDSSAGKSPVLWPLPALGREAQVPWGWLVGLVVVAGVLRSIALNQQLWFDEIVTLLDSARDPISRIVTTYEWQNRHMLYSILAHCSIRLFGEQPWALRLPAVLFGVASIPALYSCARQVTLRREALLASGLLTVSYHHVWFSQNARGYTGMVFWTLLATFFFIQCATDGRKRYWMGYGIAAALGIYTHLTMVSVVVGHAIVYAWLLASRARSLGRLPRGSSPPLYGFVMAGAASFLLYAPVLSRIFARTIGVAGSSIRSEWTNPLWTLLEMLRGLSFGTGLGLVAVGVGGVVFLSGLLSYWHSDRHLVGLMVLPGIVTAVVMLVTNHNLWPRFFFFEIGFALLLLVRGAMVWGEAGARFLRGKVETRLRLGTAFVVAMVLASVYTLGPAYRYPKQDYAGAMRFVESQQSPGEPVVTVGVVTMPYQRYYGRPWTLLETRAQLDATLSGGRAIWLLYTFPIFVQSTHPEIWKIIQSEFTTVRVFHGTLAGGDIYVCRTVGRRNWEPRTK